MYRYFLSLRVVELLVVQCRGFVSRIHYRYDHTPCEPSPFGRDSASASHNCVLLIPSSSNSRTKDFSLYEVNPAYVQIGLKREALNVDVHDRNSSARPPQFCSSDTIFIHSSDLKSLPSATDCYQVTVEGRNTRNFVAHDQEHTYALVAAKLHLVSQPRKCPVPARRRYLQDSGCSRGLYQLLAGVPAPLLDWTECRCRPSGSYQNASRTGVATCTIVNPSFNWQR